MGVTKYPDVNCKDNDPNINTQKIVSGQKFCAYPDDTSKSNVNIDRNTIQINGTINIPKNCASRKFDPQTSNIEYECSGQCPVVNSNISQSRMITPIICDVSNTTTGPNVILVHKSRDLGLLTPSSLMVGAPSMSDYNLINAYKEGNPNICPNEAWTVLANEDGTFKEDNTRNKQCYCPWTKIRKYQSTYNTGNKKYVGQIKCDNVY